jgi:hypothetical protein
MPFARTHFSPSAREHQRQMPFLQVKNVGSCLKTEGGHGHLLCIERQPAARWRLLLEQTMLLREE